MCISDDFGEKVIGDFMVHERKDGRECSHFLDG